MNYNLIECMKIPNVVSCIWDLDVNAIHMETNDKGTRYKILMIKFVLQHMPSPPPCFTLRSKHSGS
jgi:hypothetical protein